MLTDFIDPRSPRHNTAGCFTVGCHSHLRLARAGDWDLVKLEVWAKPAIYRYARDEGDRVLARFSPGSLLRR
jgi:hypothetical protein